MVRLHPDAVPPSPVTVASVDRPSPRPASIPDRARFLRGAIYAGSIGSLLSLLPLGFAIGLPLAGVLAVRFYRSGVFQLSVPPKLGFRLGALSGLVAFGMLVLVKTISMAAFGGGGELRQGMLDTIHRAQTTNPDPQSQRILEFFLTQQGMAVMILASLLILCVIFVVLAGLGGLVSAAMSQRRSDH